MVHILVVEDDEQFGPMLTQMLSQDGHKVSLAKDGAEGLQRAQSEKPDLIITDILMPKTDGIEFILALARLGNETPIIAMSGGRRAISAEFNLESASLMGVKASLAKPFARADLRNAIEKALN